MLNEYLSQYIKDEHDSDKLSNISSNQDIESNQEFIIVSKFLINLI